MTRKSKTAFEMIWYRKGKQSEIATYMKFFETQWTNIHMASTNELFVNRQNLRLFTYNLGTL